MVPVLYDETATGFGMNAFAVIIGEELDHVMLRGFSLLNYFIMADASYYLAVFFNKWERMVGFNLSFPDIWHLFLYEYNDKELNPEKVFRRYPGDPYGSAAVRCIKN